MIHIENSDRVLHITRFVPPGHIYPNVQRSIGKRHDLEVRDGQVLDFSSDALRDEPCRLNKHNGFSEPVAFAPVLDFILGWQLKFTCPNQSLDFFDVKWVTWSASAAWSIAFPELKPSHNDEKSMCRCPI